MLRGIECFTEISHEKKNGKPLKKDSKKNGKDGKNGQKALTKDEKLLKKHPKKNTLTGQKDSIVVPFIYACEKFNFDSQLRKPTLVNFKVNKPVFWIKQEEVFFPCLRLSEGNEICFFTVTLWLG